MRHKRAAKKQYQEYNAPREVPAPRNDARAFTVKTVGRAKQLITEIKLCAGFDPAIQAGPEGNYETALALWDTGANISSITKKTAEKLKLTPRGFVEHRHFSGISQHPIYIVNVTLPNNVEIHSMQFSEAPSHLEHVGAIIGLDIISRGDFCVSNPGGNTWFTFRIPSIGGTDYVREKYGENIGDGTGFFVPQPPRLL